MTDHSILQALVAQAWQLAALAVVVAVCVRYAARNRPHLAHALWLVVLLKCVTPPIWCSPIGVFSWLSPTSEESTLERADPASVMATQIDATTLAAAADGALGPADVTVEARANRSLLLESAISSDLEFAEAEQGAFSAQSGWLVRAGLIIWGAGVIAMTVFSAIRFAACWRRLRRSEVETHPELESLVAQLTKTLRVRRQPWLLVTDSRIGPAVIGLWRPTILLPACVVRGRAADELEPILAHELIHIRRGDLWVGLLQTITQALWWFHPLVWLAGRMITREAERCCDEEVIGELRCEPSRYARSLLGVLEWKRILIAAPAVPGVRAVEITSRRLERIMTLGQGCRRRTPWWCWGIMLLVAALVLPGSPLQLHGDEPAAEGEPDSRKGAIDRIGVSPAPAQQPAEPIEFPPERIDWDGFDADSSSDKSEWNLGMQSRVPRTGKPRQVWGVDDLLSMIEKQENVDRAEAKKRLWLRLCCAQRNAESAAANAATEKTSSPRPYASSPPADKQADAEEPTVEKPVVDPDRKPFWRGDRLVLSEDPAAAKRTRAAIEQMRKFGFEEVEIEVRFITAHLDLITDVSSAWTTLPMKSASDVVAELNGKQSLPATDATSGVASFAIEKNLPVILDVLEDARAKRLIDNAQGHRRANVLQAPRVRVGNGQTAQVLDTTQTPFVVGFKDKQPQISVVSEGTTVRVRPVLAGDKAHLDFEVVLARIGDVDEVKVRVPDGEETIQSPEVAQSRVTANIDVPLGQSVLIGGLKDARNPKSKTSVAVLLTVRKAPVDKPRAKQTSRAVEFEGNAAVADGELRPLVESRKPLIWVHKGKPDTAALDEDVERLTTYYRCLGFFKVRIGRDLAINEKHESHTAVFTVDEGPRYVVEKVSIAGNTKFDEKTLRDKLTLKGGDFFDQEKMNKDMLAIEETYAEAGHGSVEVDSLPIFSQEPGKFELKYRITEESERPAGGNATGSPPEKTSQTTVDNRPSPGKPEGRCYRIEGNKTVETQKILETINLPDGQPLDRAQAKAAVSKLLKTHWFVSVESRFERGPDGSERAVIQVVERPPVRTVKQVEVDRLRVKQGLPSYPILGPITSGESAKALDPPSPDDVLRAVKKAEAASRKTGPQEMKVRDNVRMTIERVATFTDPSRVYPLIGPAQLCHARYKCTLHYDETKKQGWPLPYTSAKKESQEVVYVDHNHFHLVGEADAARAEAKMDAIYTVTYAVADLIMPFPNPVTITAEKDAKPLPQAIADFDPLINLIVSTIRPASWKENGGDCEVSKFPKNLSLVITQNEDGHQQINALLKQLRDNLDKQVVLDCRTVDDPTELFRLMNSDGKSIKQAGLGMLPPDIAAKAHQAAEAKGGRNFKLTVFNGQQLKLPMLHEPSEGKARVVTIQPMISKKDGTARLRIADSAEGALQPWQQQEMTVLECGSLLIDAKKYPLGDAFGVTPPAPKDSAKAKPVYVLITPRMIEASGATRSGK